MTLVISAELVKPQLNVAILGFPQSAVRNEKIAPEEVVDHPKLTSDCNKVCESTFNAPTVIMKSFTKYYSRGTRTNRRLGARFIARRPWPRLFALHRSIQMSVTNYHPSYSTLHAYPV